MSVALCSWVPGSRPRAAGPAGRPGDCPRPGMTLIFEFPDNLLRGGDDIAVSGEEALFFEPVIEVGDVFAVAVPFQGRAATVDAEHPLGRLAPARVRHLGVDIRPEAVLIALHGLPERHRALFGKREADDR